MLQLRTAAVLLVAILVSACGDSPTPPPTPAAIQANGTLPAVASVGATLSPAVRVTDTRGRAVSGVVVSFQVTAGGGSLSSATATTNMNGVATLQGWFLGQTPGTNTLVATHGSLAPVTFTVNASDTELLKFAGDQTTCPTGASAGCRFSVRLRQQNGTGVPNQTIIWTGPGGATLNTTTNAQGYATAPNLGTNSTTGTFTQTARAQTSGAEVSFTYTLVTPGQYTIDIRFIGTISPSQQAAFIAAKQRWEQVITGDLPNVNLNIAAGQACRTAEGTSLINHPAINESVDDLLVYVQVDSIDGPGAVLGQAGPCLVRTNGRLPVFGMMRFDVADFNAIEANGLLGDVVLHELGHVLGFPNTWNDSPFALLQDTASIGGNPRFTGARAGSAFVLAGGTLLSGNGVPVENTGSQGTRLAHWRESVLSNELMTGFINSSGTTTPRNPLSAITIGSLMDIGYQVNFGAADAYMLPGAGVSALMAQGPRLEMVELPMPKPREVR